MPDNAGTRKNKNSPTVVGTKRNTRVMNMTAKEPSPRSCKLPECARRARNELTTTKLNASPVNQLARPHSDPNAKAMIQDHAATLRAKEIKKTMCWATAGKESARSAYLK